MNATETTIEVVAEAVSDSQPVCEYLYGFRPGQTARVIRGRKIKVGEVVRIETRPTESIFGGRSSWSVRTSAGWTDVNNLEVIPAPPDVADTGPMKCRYCNEVKPATRFVYSAWNGFGQPRYPRTGYTAGYARYQDGGNCADCEADGLSGFAPGTDGHTLALAVLAGDLSAVAPLIDEMIADGNEYRADELKRLHKFDKPARRSRKKSTELVPVG